MHQFCRSMLGIFLLLISGTLTLEAQTYDLQFVLVQNDSVQGGLFRVGLQIRRGTGNDFFLGSSNFRFGYNSAALRPASPFISVEANFDDGSIHPGLGVPTYSDMTSVGTDTAGFASVNVDLLTTGFGFPQIGGGPWTDIGTVDFVIKDVSAFCGLAFRTSSPGNNIVFDHDQQTILTQGSFSGLNQVIGEKKQPPVSISQGFTICEGEFIAVGGSVYTVSGQYADTMFATAPNPDTIFLTSVQVNPLPVVTLTQWNATLTVSSTISGTIQWVNCGAGYAPVAGEDSSFFAPPANGTYAAIVTAGNCSDTSACISINTVSVDRDLADELVSVWPNPSGGNITAEFPAGVFHQIRVFTIQGRLVGEVEIAPGQSKVNLEGEWPSGLYILQLCGDAHVLNRKWQVNR